MNGEKGRWLSANLCIKQSQMLLALLPTSTLNEFIVKVMFGFSNTKRKQHRTLSLLDLRAGSNGRDIAQNQYPFNLILRSAKERSTNTQTEGTRASTKDA